MLTLIASVALLGHGLGATETAGVLVVAAGVLLVSGRSGHGDARALLAVATIAASIAAYTLVDRAGIQHAGALTYFVLVLAGPCLVYPPLVGRAPIRRELRWSPSSRRVANVGSFALGLLALRHGPAAPVLAVRSSSIVIATLLAGRLLAEQVAAAASRARSSSSAASRCSPSSRSRTCPGNALGEEPREQRARQADHVEVVALDPLDEARAEALDRVGAGAPLPLARRRRSARARAA